VELPLAPPLKSVGAYEMYVYSCTNFSFILAGIICLMSDGVCLIRVFLFAYLLFILGMYC